MKINFNQNIRYNATNNIIFEKQLALFYRKKRRKKTWKISLDWDFGRPNLISLFDGYENPFTNIPFYRNGKNI